MKKIMIVLERLGQLRCLNKSKEAIALLPLCCVIPLAGMSIPVGGHSLHKNKIPHGIINFFVV